MLGSLPIVRKQGGWSTLDGGWSTLNAMRSSWVAHPFGFWFTKGCGFRVNSIAGIVAKEIVQLLTAQADPVKPSNAEGLS